MASGVCSSVVQQNGGSGGQVGGDQEELRTKLILNYLPHAVTKRDIRILFSTIGEIESCKLIKNNTTGQCAGYGFINYQKPEHAKMAITKFNGWSLLNRAIKVSYARVNSESITRTNLFVSGLPINMTQRDFVKMFCPYGKIIRSLILRDFQTGISKGIGFVRYNQRLESEQAIQKLNGTKPTNFTETITVKFAYNTYKNKTYRPSSLLGHMPPLFDRQFPESFHCPIPIRRIRRRRPDLSNYIRIHGNVNKILEIFLSSFLVTGTFLLSFTKYKYSSMAINLPPNSMYPECAMNGTGWCIFIYNLATEADEYILWHLFGPFGAVQDVTIIRDLQTNKCKGFGFVRMAKYEEAVTAIRSLDGYILDYRKLQVRFKTNKSKTPNDHKDDDVKRVRFAV